MYKEAIFSAMMIALLILVTLQLVEMFTRSIDKYTSDDKSGLSVFDIGNNERCVIYEGKFDIGIDCYLTEKKPKNH
jgi:hypothetical protein